MPRKVFTAGEVLSASNVNSFLMNQTVMTFDGSAARSSAIGTATEGMVTWLNDSNSLEVYDGTQWNGLAASGGNAVINGAFDIWQRGTSFSVTSTSYTADRFRSDVLGSSTVASRQTFTPGAAPVAGYESSFFLRNVVTSVAGSGNYALINQIIEDVRTLAGQTATLSFWAKADSAKSIAIEVAQSFGTGGSAQVTTAGGKIALTTSWVRYSVTVSVPSISGKTIGTDSGLSIRFWMDAGSSFNSRTGTLGQQNITLDLWGVQLEAGPTANVFRRNANSLQGELAACQRYYYRITATATAELMAWGAAYNTGTARFSVPFPVPMRIKPTALEASGTASDYQIAISGVGNITCTAAPSFSLASLNLATINASTTTGMTAYHPVSLTSVATNAFIGWSAEL